MNNRIVQYVDFFIFTLLAVLIVFPQNSAIAREPFDDSNVGSLKPLTVFKDCDVCPHMVNLPYGEFQLGASPSESESRRKILTILEGKTGNGDAMKFYQEGPVTTVKMDINVAIGKNEVTYEEWAACAKDGYCEERLPPTNFLVPNPGGSPIQIDLTWLHPVTHVSFDDIQNYIQWINQKTGTTEYRLPTEAEWEFAARAGTKTKFAHGNEINTEQANFLGRATEKLEGKRFPNFVSRGHPVPVNDLAAQNHWGIRHMSGNVLEITMTCWADTHQMFPVASMYIEQPDEQTCDRVIKSGTFAVARDRTRPGARGFIKQSKRYSAAGFRILKQFTN